MKLAPALLTLCLLYAPISVARAQNAPVPAASASLPRDGEIALEGRVAALGNGQWTLEVIAFTNPNGQRAVLKSSKTKTITSDATNLKIGALVTVIGVNDGATLRAREIIGATPTDNTATPTDNAAKPTELEALPTVFRAGELTITPVQGDFDYVQRVFPDWSPLTTTPVFVCTFDVAGATDIAQNDLWQRLVMRRIVGPQGQFVPPAPFSANAMSIKGKPNRVGFYNAAVDPNWEWIDVDLDVLPAPDDKPGGQIVLKDLVLPAPGAQTPINREFTGTLGTRFTAVKLKRNEEGDLVLVVHHQRPAKPTDLELVSYHVSYGGKEMGLTGGGLRDSRSPVGDNEIRLTAPEKATVLPQVELEIFENAPSMENRALVTHRRLRYALRKNQIVAPFSLPNSTQPLGKGATGELSVRIDSDGLTSSPPGASLLVWTLAPSADTQRGVRWRVADGTATFDNGAPNAPVQQTMGSLYYRWHSDRTPLETGETIELKRVALPAGAKSYDLKLNLEGRMIIEDWFEREIPLPTDFAPLVPVDDEDHSLILRKVQRYSKTDNPRIRWSNSPETGVALVFEFNPLMPDADYEAFAFDAEDDTGRKLKLDLNMDEKIPNGDRTAERNAPLTSNGNSKFYTLALSEPAQGAKSVRVWLRATESSHKVEKTTVEIKNVDAALSAR